MADFELNNYCVAFLDLLGQRDAMRGEGLLPQFTTKEQEEAFRARIRGSVGQIVRLQEAARDFMTDFPALSIRPDLSDEEKISYDAACSMKMKQQRWSDGLVLYTTMQGAAPMNAIFDIFGSAGALCLLGLARKAPIRGGIDIAWGVELHEGELYGPVVANSYELEAKAQYPRIVVGDGVVKYFDVVIEQSNPDDKVQMINKALAQVCRNMVTQDIDGFWILNYLGGAFSDAVTKENSSLLYKAAHKFAEEQFDIHRQARNSKLATRYNWLLAYFAGHQE